MSTAPIEARELRKTYGPVVAVRDLSFTVARGEILGLLGPNGAGKSTTLRMLIGFQYPDAGSAYLNGSDVFRAGDQARASLGYMPEVLPLYAEMTVREYLRFFSSLKRVTRAAQAEERVVALLDLAAVLDRPCGNISRGYRQRVGLAQALLADPAVLILDEPTSGLDPNQIHDFRQIIKELGKERAILLSTHILSEALEICDRVLILNRGQAAAAGSPRSLASAGASSLWVRLRSAAPISESLLARHALVREGQSDVYRVEAERSAEESRELLRTIGEQGWELLEWHTGSSGLETVFRRLTLGEERD